MHTGCEGGPTGAGEPSIFSLGNAIQAVGEGNYGRRGPGRQQRYTDANAEAMFAQPYTGTTPDEQPEILPSPWDAGPADANIERCWSCRAMFMQAWGHVGTPRPVVHQQLGVRPALGRRRLEAAPVLRPDRGARDPPRGRFRRRLRSAARRDLHDGRPHAPATAERARDRPHARARRAHRNVRLDGRRARWNTRLTNRGLEVTVRARPGRHVLQVKVHR